MTHRAPSNIVAVKIYCVLGNAFRLDECNESGEARESEREFQKFHIDFLHWKLILVGCISTSFEDELLFAHRSGINIVSVILNVCTLKCIRFGCLT